MHKLVRAAAAAVSATALLTLAGAPAEAAATASDTRAVTRTFWSEPAPKP
ncbi:hypothetical protein [Streptomyces yangpuensis]